MFIIMVILIVLVIILSILLTVLGIKYKKLQNKFYTSKKLNNRRSNSYLMIEYLISAYKEQNKNPYTVLRDISNIVYREDKDDN